MVEQDGDARESRIARQVLEHLARWRPTPRDVDADAVGLRGPNRHRDLLTVMATLCDSGLVMYEAIVMRAGTPCFRDAAITISGCAALQTMQRGDPAGV